MIEMCGGPEREIWVRASDSLSFVFLFQTRWLLGFGVDSGRCFADD
jgi:hypothetical protein